MLTLAKGWWNCWTYVVLLEKTSMPHHIEGRRLVTIANYSVDSRRLQVDRTISIKTILSLSGRVSGVYMKM
jgi:hypothetical protein